MTELANAASATVVRPLLNFIVLLLSDRDEGVDWIEGATLLETNDLTERRCCERATDRLTERVIEEESLRGKGPGAQEIEWSRIVVVE
jgi:hypothetical protein